MGILDGAAVIVTGAAKGLGREYALACATEGAAVVINDVDARSARRLVEEIATTGGNAVEHVGSVASWESACELVRLCANEFGDVSALVNNAGILRAANMWQMSTDDIRAVIEVNLQGTIFCGAAALAEMVTKGAGVILNVTSSAQLGVERLAVYGATKAAVTCLTQAWALEGSEYGIRVNALSPLARTDILDSWDGNAAHRASRESYAEPARVAPIVPFLLSDQSAPMTGQVVRYDGSSAYLLAPAFYDRDRAITAAGELAQFARLRDLASRPAAGQQQPPQTGAGGQTG